MEDSKNFNKWSTISHSCKLQVLSKNEIILPACDGKATFAQMKESRMYGYFEHIDPNFKNWGTDKPGKATPETKIAVYKNLTEAKAREIFEIDRPKLCLTQDQCLRFISRFEYKWITKDGESNLFLFENDNEFFVVRIFLGPAACLFNRVVHVYKLEESEVIWSAKYYSHIIVPQ